MNDEFEKLANAPAEDDIPLNPNPEIPPVDFESTPINQWRRLSIAHRMCSELLLKSTGVNDVSQPALLMALSSCPDCTSESQKILAEKLHVTPATITVSLRSMIRNGYVTKQVDEHDQRRKHIVLTDKGKEACRLLSGFTDILDSEMYKDFTEEERALCASFFLRMTENLENAAVNIRRVIKKRQRLAARQAEEAAEAAEAAKSSETP